MTVNYTLDYSFLNTDRETRATSVALYIYPVCPGMIPNDASPSVVESIIWNMTTPLDPTIGVIGFFKCDKRQLLTTAVISGLMTPKPSLVPFLGGSPAVS